MKLLIGTVILALSAVFVAAQQDKQSDTPTPAAQAAQTAKVIAELAAARTGGVAKTSSGSVKNVPFSADEVNESIQTLADGNRIVRNTTGKIYRNSAGRVRRDMPGGTGGMFGSTFTMAPGVTLLDSGAGFRYQLDNNLKIAQQMELKTAPDMRIKTELLQVERAGATAAQKASIDAQRAAIERAKSEIERAAATIQAMPVPAIAPVPPVAVVSGDMPQLISGALAGTTIHPAPQSKYETRTEQLGNQNIEGVDAVGTRTITTIPAGAIGNERPIEVVYERWYSEELKMIVYSKRSDPRVGEQTYRLTNINRSEPDPSLFSVQGYRIVSPARTAVSPSERPKATRVARDTRENRFVKNTTKPNN